MRLLLAFAFVSGACGGWIEDEVCRQLLCNPKPLASVGRLRTGSSIAKAQAFEGWALKVLVDGDFLIWV